MFSLTGLLAYFVPCYVVGKSAEAVDENCIAHAIAFYIPLLNWYCIAHVRGKIRERHGIEASHRCALTPHVGLIQFLFITGYICERLSLDIILPLLCRDANAQCKLMYHCEVVLWVQLEVCR